MLHFTLEGTLIIYQHHLVQRIDIMVIIEIRQSGFEKVKEIHIGYIRF